MKPKWEFISCHRMDDFPDIIAEVRTGGHVNQDDLRQIWDEMLERVGDDGERDYEMRICGSYITAQSEPYPIPMLEIVLRPTVTEGRHAFHRPTGPDSNEKTTLERMAR